MRLSFNLIINFNKSPKLYGELVIKFLILEIRNVTLTYHKFSISKPSLYIKKLTEREENICEKLYFIGLIH